MTSSPTACAPAEDPALDKPLHTGELGSSSLSEDPDASPRAHQGQDTPAPQAPPAHDIARRSGAVALLGVALILCGLSIIWHLRLGTDAAIYVSGFGAAGRDTAPLFNSGLFLIGAGGFGISLASLRLRAPAPKRLLRAFCGALGIASLCFIAASRITCSLGCPLPFTPQAVWQDAVHVVLACAGFGLAVTAILLSTGLTASTRPLVFPTVLGVALPAAAGGILSLLGVSPLIGGWLELLATTVALVWLMLFGVWVFRARPANPPAHSSSSSGLVRGGQVLWNSPAPH